MGTPRNRIRIATTALLPTLVPSRPPALLPVVLSIFLGLLSRPLPGQTPPSDLGAGPTRAEIRRIDSVFAFLDNTRSPGCALGVLRDDHLALARGFGMANLDHGIAITPRTVFRTGSVSKQFTAAVVVLLAREGAFSLDDDIRDHFPEIPEFDAPITVRHLLHHTSGIRDYLELMGMRGVGDEATYTEEDVVELLARQEELNFPPGSRFLYSNSGYLLLSRLVERATGKNLRQQARRLIFGPLGMTSTHFHDDHNEIVPHRATGYDRDASGAFVVNQTTLDIVGDGGVFTSVEEISRWMENFWTLQVGGEAWLETLETRGILDTGDTLSYAMGLSHGVHRGIPWIGHGGSFVGYRAGTLRYPQENLAITVLCNYARTNPMGLAQGVGEILLEDRMDPAPEPTRSREEAPAPGPQAEDPPVLDPARAEAYLGTYYSEEVDATIRVLQSEDGLAADVNGAWDLPMVYLGNDQFRARHLTLTFQREGQAITGFRAGSGRAGGVRFLKR